MERTFAILGALFAFLGVALGAFGAHALKTHFEADPGLERIYRTAVEYHLIHALGLFACAWAAGRWPGPLTCASGWLLAAGIPLFSGSLYALALSGQRWLGAVAPLGGLAFLAGWACLALAAWKGPAA